MTFLVNNTAGKQNKVVEIDEFSTSPAKRLAPNETTPYPEVESVGVKSFKGSFRLPEGLPRGLNLPTGSGYSGVSMAGTMWRV
jgi:hypothetical protein